MPIPPGNRMIPTVIEKGAKMQETGLLFPNGRPIYKVTYPNPIGFMAKFNNEDDEETQEK